MSDIYSNNDKEMVLARYMERIKQSGMTIDSLNSGSVEKQHARHEAHAAIFSKDKASVLDIGCGIGQFSDYLTLKGIAHQYNGYDIVPDYITYCKEHFPEGHFEVRNVFEQGIEGEYDYIVLSQVLNNRFRDSDNMQVMKEMMRICFEKTKVALSIDMMSTYVDFRSDELFYYQPEEIFSYAKSLTTRVALRHDARPYEFLIQLFR